MNINWRELYANTMDLAIWGDQFKGKGILVHCHNAFVMQIMAKCSSKSKSMVVLVCSLAMFGIKHNFNLHLQHIPGVENGIADAHLRFKHKQFWQLAPSMDPTMMPLASFAY